MKFLLKISTHTLKLKKKTLNCQSSFKTILQKPLDKGLQNEQPASKLGWLAK